MASAKAKTLVIMGDAHFLPSHVLPQGASTARTEAGATAIRMALDDWQRRATAAGVTHTVIVNLPCRRIDPARLDASVWFFAAQGSDDAAVDWANGVMAQWVHEHPDTQIADLHAHLCQGGFHPVLNGVSLDKDTLHFSERGAVMVWTWLAPIVQAAAPG